MSLPYERNNITAGLNSDARLNAELEKIRLALRQGLSRLGVAPNAMESPLDMGLHDILNVATIHVKNILIDGQELPDLSEMLQVAARVEADADRAESAADTADLHADAAEVYRDQAESFRDAAEGESNSAAGYATAASNSAAEASGYVGQAEAARNAAQLAASDAEGSAQSADASATASDNSATLSDSARAAAVLAQNQAESYATAAGNAQVAAEAAQSGAETARDEAVAAAAGLGIPEVEPGDAGKTLRVNAAEDGYELFTPEPERAISTEAQARGRTNNDTVMTPLRVGQSIDAYLPTVEFDGRAANTYDTPPLDAWAIGPTVSGGDVVVQAPLGTYVPRRGHVVVVTSSTIPAVEPGAYVVAAHSDTNNTFTITVSAAVPSAGWQGTVTFNFVDISSDYNQQGISSVVRLGTGRFVINPVHMSVTHPVATNMVNHGQVLGNAYGGSNAPLMPRSLRNPNISDYLSPATLIVPYNVAYVEFRSGSAALTDPTSAVVTALPGKL